MPTREQNLLRLTAQADRIAAAIRQGTSHRTDEPGSIANMPGGRAAIARGDILAVHKMYGPAGTYHRFEESIDSFGGKKTVATDCGPEQAAQWQQHLMRAPIPECAAQEPLEVLSLWHAVACFRRRGCTDEEIARFAAGVILSYDHPFPKTP